MDWISLVLSFSAIVFAIGFALGHQNGSSPKSSKGKEPKQLHDARLRGQRELRDYIVEYLSTQKDIIHKKDILKHLGVSSTQPTKNAQEHLAQNMPTKVSKSKEQREFENINLTLYVASFLLVAAAVLFVGTAIPDGLKFIGIWLIVIVFYISGMLLHAFQRKLRPAATAFVGTGLAILPFAGLATDTYVVHDPNTSWLVTSFIGVIAFIAATYRIKSQILAYLSLGFVFSLTVSSVEVLQVPLVWSFTSLIIVASFLNLLALVDKKHSDQIFQKPIDVSAQLIVPLAVFGSWIVTGEVSDAQRAIILLVAALHYALSALHPSSKVYKSLYIFLVRSAISGAVLLLVRDATNEESIFATALIIVSLAQLVISALILKSNKPSKHQDEYSQAWLWIGFAMQLWASYIFYGLQDLELVVVGVLAGLTFSSLAVAYHQRKSRYAGVAVLTLPLIVWHIAGNIVDPPIANDYVALIFAFGTIAATLVRALWCRSGEKLEVAASAIVVYGAISLLYTLLGSLSDGWIFFILLILFAVTMWVSYIEKTENFLLLAYPLLFASIFKGIDAIDMWNIVSPWILTSWIFGTISYALRGYFIQQKDTMRGTITFIASLGVLLSIGIAFVFDDVQIISAAVTLLLASVLLAIEYLRDRKLPYYEISLVVVTLALQRLVAHYGEFDSLVYTHWWAGVFMLLGAARYYFKDKNTAQAMAVIGLVLLSVPTGLVAMYDSTKQLLFLLEHIVLLIIAVLLGYRLATIWAAVAIALAVLYFLQGYAFLLLAIVGFGLLIFAIAKLLSRSL